MPAVNPVKPVEWIGTARRDLHGLPDDVRKTLGYALYEVQRGKYPLGAKLLKGDLRGLLELNDDFVGDTCRAVCTVELTGVVYVLHVFQKKSTHGIGIPKRDARRHSYTVAAGKGTSQGTSRGVLWQKGEHTMTKRRAVKRHEKRHEEIPVTRGSGNVFADIGLPNPERHLAKAQLVSLIDDALRARQLTQQEAAALLGIDQPKISRMLRGHFDGISTQRLLDFLNALGRDVEIVVRPAPKSRKRGRLHVAA